MKKFVLILMILAVLFAAGCSKQPEAVATEPTAAPTVPATEATEPTEPETEPTVPETEPVPQTVDILVQTDFAPAILLMLSRGETVDVVGEYDPQHMIIKTPQGYGLVQKQLLRMEGAALYESWTGYSYKGTEVFGGFQLLGEPLMTLSRNDEVEVLEELAECYLINVEGTLGFVAKDGLSSKYLRSSGGSSSGGSGGADGGDISMEYYGGVQLLSTIEQSGEVTGTATVLCDGTPVVLWYFDRENLVPVVTEEGFAPAWEGYYTLYLNGLYAYMPCDLALAPDAEPFAPWEGYSASKTDVYDNYTLSGEPLTRLKVNTKITVLWETDDCYLIQTEDVTGCIPKEKADTSKFYTGGGSSSGGSSGGDWTPPAL